MKFELQLFILLIIIGLVIKRIDWRGQFFLILFIGLWIMYNWKRG